MSSRSYGGAVSPMAATTAAGDDTARTWQPCGLSSRRSASSTSGWSSATSTRTPSRSSPRGPVLASSCAPSSGLTVPITVSSGFNPCATAGAAASAGDDTSWAEGGGWVRRLLVRIWDGPLPYPDEARAVLRRVRASARKQAARDEEHVRRTLGQAAHVPGQPVRAVADEHAHGPAVAYQALLLGARDAGEEMELGRRLGKAAGRRLREDRIDERAVVRPEHVAGGRSRGRGLEQALREREVARVHIRLARERAIGRLVVRALDQPDAGPGGPQRLEVGRGAAQVGLEAHAHPAVPRAGAADETQGGLRVRGLLHVDPDEVARRLCAGHQREQARGAALLVEVEPELRRLHRDLDGAALVLHALEQLQVVRDHGVRFRVVGDVLAEAREHRAHPGPAQRARRGQRVGGLLSGHEAGDGPPHEGAAHRALAQPSALRAGEERAPKKSHRNVSEYSHRGTRTHS